MSLRSYFQVSPEMFDRVQVLALVGQLKDIQRLVPKPLLHFQLGCACSEYSPWNTSGIASVDQIKKPYIGLREREHPALFDSRGPCEWLSVVFSRKVHKMH